MFIPEILLGVLLKQGDRQTKKEYEEAHVHQEDFASSHVCFKHVCSFINWLNTYGILMIRGIYHGSLCKGKLTVRGREKIYSDIVLPLACFFGPLIVAAEPLAQWATIR
jgi:hypothetical protein